MMRPNMVSMMSAAGNVLIGINPPNLMEEVENFSNKFFTGL